MYGDSTTRTYTDHEYLYASRFRVSMPVVEVVSRSKYSTQRLPGNSAIGYDRLNKRPLNKWQLVSIRSLVLSVVRMLRARVQ